MDNPFKTATNESDKIMCIRKISPNWYLLRATVAGKRVAFFAPTRDEARAKFARYWYAAQLREANL